jgi:hypothetical protein
MELTMTSTVPLGRGSLNRPQALRVWLLSACPSGTKPFAHRTLAGLSANLFRVQGSEVLQHPLGVRLDTGKETERLGSLKNCHAAAVQCVATQRTRRA